MFRRRGIGPFARVALLALPVLLVLAGCGRDDFKNEPKPAVPLEATIEISRDRVDISPSGFGAGLVNFVIANNSDAEVALTIDGPVDETSSPIPSNGNGIFKVEMTKGDYRLSVPGDEAIEPATIVVGPDRESANNDLLLP